MPAIINRLVPLHGGASAALAETRSMAGYLMTRDGQCVVGTELNATPPPRRLAVAAARRPPPHLGRRIKAGKYAP